MSVAPSGRSRMVFMSCARAGTVRAMKARLSRKRIMDSPD